MFQKQTKEPKRLLVRIYRDKAKHAHDAENKVAKLLEEDANKMLEAGYELVHLFGRPPAESSGGFLGEVWLSLYAVYRLYGGHR